MEIKRIHPSPDGWDDFKKRVWKAREIPGALLTVYVKQAVYRWAVGIRPSSIDLRNGDAWMSTYTPGGSYVSQEINLKELIEDE